MTITIYHNPACGTSRNNLAMIRQSGEEPVVIEYLKNPLSRARLVELVKAMGIQVRALLREKGKVRKVVRYGTLWMEWRRSSVMTRTC